LGLAVPGSAQAGVLGQQINEAAKKGADAKLASNPEYQKATAERKKQIQEETIQEMTRLEMDRIKNDLQRKIDKKIQGVVDAVLIKALPDTDKRIPEIKRQFLTEMYRQMNHREDANTFYICTTLHPGMGWVLQLKRSSMIR